VTFDEYLQIMRQKAMEKETIKEIRKRKKKEKEEKWIKKVANSQVVVRCAIQRKTNRQTERQERLNFVATWFPVIMKESREQLHRNIKVRLHVEP
jgi:hypothetical protein